MKLMVWCCILVAMVASHSPALVTANKEAMMGAMHAFLTAYGNASDETLKAQHKSIPDRVKARVKELGKSLTTKVAVKAGNASKNRYDWPIPYDTNRVILSGGRYINASPVSYDKVKTHFIVTQEPLHKRESGEESSAKDDTVGDFWEMVAIPDSVGTRLIVMLNGSDSGEKPYWFEDKASCDAALKKKDYNHAAYVKGHSNPAAYYAHREMQLISSGAEDLLPSIDHLQFVSWPDHDAPESYADMMAFLRVVRRRHNKASCPLIVHCSAGASRSGTVVALLIVMELIDGEQLTDINDKDYIANLVVELRLERMLMVMDEELYIFLYRAVVALCAEYLRGTDHPFTGQLTPPPVPKFKTKKELFDSFGPGWEVIEDSDSDSDSESE